MTETAARLPVGHGRIVKNTILLYVRMLVAMFVGLYTSRVILRYLGITDFGLYNVAGAVVSMLAILIGSLSTATSRYITVGLGEANPDRINKIYSTSVNIHLLLAVLVVVVLAAMGPWILSSRINIPADRLEAVRFSFACVVVTVAIGILASPFNAMIVAHERMNAFAWFSLVDVFARLGIAYSISITPFDNLKTYALLLALVQLLYAALNMGYSMFQFRSIRYVLCFDGPLFRGIFSFAGWSLVTSVTVILTSQCVTILNQRYFGAGVVAAVALALTVQSHLMAFINNFKTAANPQIIKLYAAGQHGESRRLLLDAALLAVFIFLVLAVPLWVYADRVLALWLEIVPPHAVAFVRIVLITSFFIVFDTSYYTALYAKGRLRESVLFNIVLGAVTFSLIWLTIAKTGNVYAALVIHCINTMVVGLVVKPLLLVRYVGYSNADFWNLYKPVVRVSVLSGVCGYLAFLVTPVGVVGLLFGASICAGAICLLCWRLGLPLDYRVRVLALLSSKFPILARFVG